MNAYIMLFCPIKLQCFTSSYYYTNNILSHNAKEYLAYELTIDADIFNIIETTDR